MSENNTTSQFELFPSGKRQEYHPNISYLQPRTVRLQTEHIVGICLFLIVSNVLCYCLGVRQGRGPQAEAGFQDPKIVADNTAEDAIIVSSVPEKTEVFELPEEMAAVPEPEPERVEVLQIAVPEEVMDDGSYTIQVASFKKETTAQKEATWLKDKGYETYVVRKGDYAIVTVGQFRQAQEAKAYSQRLTERYKDCLVRRF